MVEVQDNARLAMERMASDIRSCKRILDETVGAIVYNTDANNIYYWVDDGDAVVEEAEVRRFSYSAADKRIRYGTAGTIPLADHVTSFSATYYNGPTQVTTDEENANRVKIFFTVSKGSFTKNFTSSVTIRSKLI